MWPFKKKSEFELSANSVVSYTQTDYMPLLSGSDGLSPDQWVSVHPCNEDDALPESKGLPSLTASDGEVYGVASKLSQIRSSFGVPIDGVYCPVCHIANIQKEKLGEPCPQCGRGLLCFGWD